MGFFEFITAVVAITTGGTIIGNWLKYRQNVVEARFKTMQQTDDSVMAELRDMKRQVAELRDTSTQYDMSFDAALQRMESRMVHIESRVTHLEERTDAVGVQRG